VIQSLGYNPIGGEDFETIHFMEPQGQAHASTPECLHSPKQFMQPGASARRRGFLRRRMAE
jgi:hypothetical protein